MNRLSALIAGCVLSSPAFAADLPPAPAGAADTHIVVVRHAEKACNGLECALSEAGEAQAARLAGMMTGLQDDGLALAGVHASSACRTVMTVALAADAAVGSAQPVIAYPAVPGANLCGFAGDTEEESRPGIDERPVAGAMLGDGAASSREQLIAFLNDTAAAAESAAPRFWLTADHSNFVCGWFAALGVPDADIGQECPDGKLSEADYADIYWLYDELPGEGARWRLVILEDAF